MSGSAGPLGTLRAEHRLRSLTAARIGGLVAVSVVAHIAVDMPGGYFGPSDRLTTAGIVYSLAVVVGGALLLVALRADWRTRRWLQAALLVANLAVFGPALTSDPIVAGLAIAWTLWLLAELVVPPAPPAREPAFVGANDDAVERWLERSGPALQHLAWVSLVLTAVVVGYRFSEHLLAVLACFSLLGAVLVTAAPFVAALLRAGSRAPLVLAVPLLAALAAAGRPSLALVLLALDALLVLGLLALRSEAGAELLRGFYTHPSRLVVASFLGLVAVGAVLLTFPAASATGIAIDPLDALFTATSATCVTGLIVLDTATAFSPFGQAVILVLIQIGGLGIMVLSTFAMLLLGGGLGLRGEQALSEVLDAPSAPSAYRLTRFIVVATLGVELVGALCLALSFRADGMAWPGALWRGLFHSISAFCNAGFALQTDSLIGFQGRPLALGVVAVLITVGGLGFVVLAGVGQRLREPHRRLPLQVRVVLRVSAVLVAVGFVLFLALEWSRGLDGLHVGDKVANALFQSVTLRTAGFNSIDFATLAPATVLAMAVLMLIGGSPGSTAGGIKTTTAVVLLAALRAAVRGEDSVRLLDREVAPEIVRRSLAIFVLSALLCVAGLFVLLLVEPQEFLPLAFETVSAFATVGLSLGATASLGPAGKLVLVVVMFIGRVGPLTLALFLGTGGAPPPRMRRPETRLMVG